MQCLCKNYEGDFNGDLDEEKKNVRSVADATERLKIIKQSAQVFGYSLF